VTTARPVCGNIVSLKQVMNSETRRGGMAGKRTSSTIADDHRRSDNVSLMGVQAQAPIARDTCARKHFSVYLR
jgi:hypothetical protein